MTKPPSGAHAGSDPVRIIGQVLTTPPNLVGEVLRGETRLTRRWRHDALHDTVGPVRGHVLMSYYGAAREIAWRTGGRRLASLTRPGSLTVIPEGESGRWDIEGSIEVSHVYLSDARLQDCADNLASRKVELLSRVGFEDQVAGHILGILSQETITTDPSSRLFVEQALDLLCTRLLRAHSSFGQPAAPVARRGLADWQVRRVTGYMEDHLDQAIGIDELAALIDLSRFHFCTAFRLATGQTPHNWLTALRMAEAKRLLLDPRFTITDVGLAVGYQTPSAFTAAFRRLERRTPRDFRQGL